MMNRYSLFGAALLLSVTSCAGTHVRVPKDGVQLIEKTTADGGTVAFRLLPGNDGPPKIHRTEKSTRQKAGLKLAVESVGADLAERLGVSAWLGVHVERVPSGSCAAKAGIVEGDILTAINDVKLVSEQQYEELLPGQLAPDTPIRFDLLRRSEQDGEVSWQPLAVEVVPDSKEVTETKTDSFSLETSEGVQRLTGLQVATIPPDLAGEIYGTSAPVTVISGVVSGSPAYLAGFRGGDRVTDCDGVEGADLSRIREVVRAHAAARGLPAGAWELPDAATARPTAVDERPGDLSLSVLGPLGSHAASFPLCADVDDSSRFYFPILFEYSGTVARTSWSFLDFIFQFGANYSGEYQRSLSRSPTRHSKLSLFPLGMFEFEHGPTKNHYTFFWLIEWTTRN